VQEWLRRPWDARRILGGLAGAALGALAVVGWRRAGRGWWWRLRGARGEGKADPVRRQAARWLRRLAGRRDAGAGTRQVVADLERLRYGPRGTWPEPPAVFRRARRTLRAERRGGD